MHIGISKFRVQTDGSPLPNARRLSLAVFKNTNNLCDHKNNELLVPWGQFVTHDMAYSPVNSINSSFPGKNEISNNNIICLDYSRPGSMISMG